MKNIAFLYCVVLFYCPILTTNHRGGSDYVIYLREKQTCLKILAPQQSLAARRSTSLNCLHEQ